jgi:hypothetical protein
VWFFALAAQTKEAAEAGARAGLTIVESSILGALLILSVALNIWAISILIKVQNKRVDDKERDATRLQDLNQKLITVLSGLENAVENLAKAEKEGQGVLQGVKQSLDTVILAAVQRGGRPTSGPYAYPPRRG